MEILQSVHSYLAYVVLAILIIAVANAILGYTGNKLFTLEKDFRISLFALILSHMQLVLGIILYFVSERFSLWGELGVGGVMKNQLARLLLVEHPFINILAIILITIGWSRHKKLMEAKRKFKTITIFYGIGLLLVLSRIPWAQWFA
jgi:hypothetical protein